MAVWRPFMRNSEYHLEKGLIQNCKLKAAYMPLELDAFLENRSSLTKTQIERLRVYISLEIGLDSSVGGEPGHVISGVSQGAYYRVLDQAKNNVEQALYTLLLCSRLGIIRADELTRLLNLVSKLPSESSENTQEVISLVEALVKKIVML